MPMIFIILNNRIILAIALYGLKYLQNAATSDTYPHTKYMRTEIITRYIGTADII